VKYAVIGGQHGQEWVMIAARCVLSSSPPSDERQLIPILPDVLLATGSLNAEGWDALVSSIVEHELVPQWLVTQANHNAGPYEFQLRFSDQGWQEPRQMRAITASSAYGVGLPALQFERASGRLSDVFRLNLFYEVDAKVPLRLPQYKNVDHLYQALLPGFHTNNNMLPTQMVQLIVELPFEMAYWNDDQILTVRAPRSAFAHRLQLITHAGRTHRVDTPTATSELDVYWSRWEIPIQWPVDENRATAKLYYDDAYIDEIDYQCWTGTLSVRAAADAHFDPGRTKLKAALQSSDNHESEYAVVRLFNLLGIPAVWYGHGYERSDAMAVFQEWESRTVALLIEVTRQKPSNKFTPLLARASAFRAALRGQAEVLPMVVVTSPASSTDFQQAEMDGIVLIDSKILTELVELLNGNPTVREVMQVLRSVRFPQPQIDRMLRFDRMRRW
jgi:hypothetical protein